MDEDLKPIVTTVLSIIAFMFVAFSAITIFSPGKIFDATAKLAAESAKEAVLPGLAAGAEPGKALTEETLVAVIEQPHREIHVQATP